MKEKLLFVFWTILIFTLCSIPGKAIPNISWLELISFDKFVHATLFFIEQFLLMRAIQPKSGSQILYALVFCVLYGGALELMQYYIFPSRSGDWLDFVANSFGAGASAAYIGRKRIKKIRQESRR